MQQCSVFVVVATRVGRSTVKILLLSPFFSAKGTACHVLFHHFQLKCEGDVQNNSRQRANSMTVQLVQSFKMSVLKQGRKSL